VKKLALWLLPGAIVVALDLALRGGQIVALPLGARAAYGVTAAETILLWGALVAAASERDGPARFVPRALLVVGAGFAIGAQLYFFARYSAFLNHQAILVGTSMLPSVGQQLWSDRASFVRNVFPPVIVAACLPLAYARVASPSRRAAAIARDLAAFAIFLTFLRGMPAYASESGATPDVLYVSGLGRLARAVVAHEDALDWLRPGPRSPLAVPRLAPRAPRNVILIVDESLRASATCTRDDAACMTTPYTHAAAPDRFVLSQMRSLASTTAASIAILWSGLPATASRDEFHSAPLVWEYARAAGFTTAYWSAQHPFFANAGLWLAGVPLDFEVTATALDPNAGYELGADDGKLVDAVIADLSRARPPLLGVVHLSNTHFPYQSDPDDAPFQPQGDALGDAPEHVLNRYKNAVRRQDKHVARLVRALRASKDFAQTIVVFVSDHGEQLREHGAIGHTFGVYDEELRVAAWIDAPAGVIGEAEASALASLENAQVTHLDVLPTVLDAMGILDAPELASLRARMPGQSLMRWRDAERPAVVLTNCTAIFACAYKNWGAMRGTRKIVADSKDRAWHCFDVANDPDEKHDLGEEACFDLRAIAEADGRGAPWRQ
jgi:hypothetical protein